MWFLLTFNLPHSITPTPTPTPCPLAYEALVTLVPF